MSLSKTAAFRWPFFLPDALRLVRLERLLSLVMSAKGLLAYNLGNVLKAGFNDS